jgi:hypothetical protein
MPRSKAGDHFLDERKGEWVSWKTLEVDLTGFGVFLGRRGHGLPFCLESGKAETGLINQRSITVAQFSRELAKMPAPTRRCSGGTEKILEQLVLKEILLRKRNVKE